MSFGKGGGATYLWQSKCQTNFSKDLDQKNQLHANLVVKY